MDVCVSDDVTANVKIGSEISENVSQRNVGVDTASGTECTEELSILHVPGRMMLYCLQKKKKFCLLIKTRHFDSEYVLILTVILIAHNV